MSNNLPLVFDQAEFDQICANVKAGYISIVPFSFTSALEAAEKYHSLRSEGYTPLDPFSLTDSFSVEYPMPGVSAVPMFRIHLSKPQEQQDADLELRYTDARANYEVTLSERLESAVVTKLAERQAEAAEIKRQERLKAHQLEMAQAEEQAQQIRQEILASLGAAPVKAKKKSA